MTDLFTNLGGIEVANSYPEKPGWKAEGTSRIAAESVEPRLGYLQGRVLAQLKGRDLTADEIAGQLMLSILTVRPRCSELLRLGKIKETNQRRPNASGKMAAVLQII